MYFRLITFCMLTVFAISAKAQSSAVVVDFETDEPISGVSIISGKKLIDTTDVNGRFTVPDSCQYITFSHTAYDARKYKVESIPDTIVLVSNQFMLRDVYVLGDNKRSAKRLQMIENQKRINHTDAELMKAEKTKGLDLFGLITLHKKKKKAKQREEIKQMLENY